MTDEKQTQEQADEEMINQGFQELLDSYLATKHRKKIALTGKFQHTVAVLQNVGHGCRQLIGKFEFIPRFSLFTGARKALPELIAVLP